MAIGKITEHGRRMAELPTHPRLAHMLIEGARRGAGEQAAELAALLGDRDILRRTDERTGGRTEQLPVDIARRLEALRGQRSLGFSADSGALTRARSEATVWRKQFPSVGPSVRHSVAALAACAYPDRIARRRDSAGRFLLVNGRGVSIPPDDPLAMSEWIVALELDDEGAESRVRLAAALDSADVVEIAATQATSLDETGWDAAASRVCRVVTRLGAIVLDEPLADPDPERLRSALRRNLRPGHRCPRLSTRPRHPGPARVLHRAVRRGRMSPTRPPLDAFETGWVQACPGT
jgi:ATP-dependent helicase HrpB